MADELFSLAFDSASIRELSAYAGISSLLAEELQGTMKEVGQWLVEAAQAKTWEVFASPTGALASTIAPVQNSPYEVQIQVGAPYGRRREYGFSGMVDSLGRYFANDPAKPYLGPTLEAKEDQVEEMLSQAVQSVLERLGAV